MTISPFGSLVDTSYELPPELEEKASKVKMDPEAKAKWVAALRGGEFKQGRSQLRFRNFRGEIRHCCLGVFCVVMNEMEPIREGMLSLTVPIKERYKLSTAAEAVLMHSNDGSGLFPKRSFKTIANWIEKHL